MPVTRLFQRTIDILFGIYAVVVFAVLALAVVLIIMLPLPIGARRVVAHTGAWTWFLVIGMPIKVLERERLPRGPCVLVANHASYLDGIVLKAALPARFSFVIKKEVSSVPIGGLLLRRIGSEFVDRVNRHTAGVAARRLLKVAESGQAIVVFPEGTFLHQPGIHPFHTGAFAIAARAGLPVVPVWLTGTRRALPDGAWLPRYARLKLFILEAIAPPPAEHSAHDVAAIRDRARAAILEAVGEPDLEGTGDRG